MKSKSREDKFNRRLDSMDEAEKEAFLKKRSERETRKKEKQEERKRRREASRKRKQTERDEEF